MYTVSEMSEMKYPNRDRKKRNRVLEMLIKGRTYTSIGAELGISRQRVQQLVAPPKERGGALLAKYDGKCARCGIPLNGKWHRHHLEACIDFNALDNLIPLCLSCHKLVHPPHTLFGGKDNQYLASRYGVI